MEGTATVMELLDQLLTVAVVVPNSTLPVALPKPSPATVTAMPGCPTYGPTLPTSGVVAFTCFCQTATVEGPSVNAVAGLLPPEPVVTVRLPPVSRPPRYSDP